MRAIFLDRDGVLIEAEKQFGLPISAKKLADVVLEPDAVSLILALKGMGYLCVMVTNQPEVARGNCDKNDVIEINDFLLKTLCLDAAYACFHDSIDECGCRKPKPGMILDATKDLQITLSSSYLIGDRWRDIDAGTAAGCFTIFIDRGYEESLNTAPKLTVSSLKEAVNWIIENENF